MNKISPKRYIQGFCIVVLALAIAREIDPSIAMSTEEKEAAESSVQDTVSVADADTVAVVETPKIVSDEAFVPHRIYSVSSFEKCFPDSNSLQLVAAEKNGIPPVSNREEAEKKKDKLVYVGSNPYFFVEKARSSIPFLVPKASALLQDIGSVFLDSLQIKGIPLHKIIVTSVLRTTEDVEKLQQRNSNAAKQSCHQYATTFDICYNRYKTVSNPDGPARREVSNDTLKWVLSEVLNDIRQQGRCYIKYEKKQSCFHITVR